MTKDIFDEFKKRRYNIIKDLTIEIRKGISIKSLQTELDGINMALTNKGFTKEER